MDRIQHLIVAILFLPLGITLNRNYFLQAQDQTDRGKIFYQMVYRPGDWITYGNMRFVYCLSIGHHQVFAGTSGGVIRYHPIKKQYDYPLTTSNGLLDNDCRVVGFDSRSGYLWIATQKGLHFWDPYSQRMTAANYSEIGLSIDEIVISIGFGNDGQIWIQTAKGFYVSYGNLRLFSKNDPSTHRIQWNGRLHLQQQKLPNLFAASTDGYYYDAGERAFVDRDFNRFPISYFCHDASGLLWIGTMGAGMWYAETFSNLMRPLTYGLFTSSVTAMIFDEESLISVGSLITSAGLYDPQRLSGLTVWNQTQDRFEHVLSSYRNQTRFDESTCLYADSLYLWVGTEQGLFQKDKRSNSWTSFGTANGLSHTAVLSVLPVQDKVFIGTRQGLNYGLKGKKNYEFYKVEIPELFNLTIYRMLNENPILWLGTNNGIYAIDQSRKSWYHFSAYGFPIGATTLLKEEIRGIAENDSLLFFASSVNVVSLNKTSRQWQSIPVQVSFLAQGINDAKADNDNLWIATNSGVLRYWLPRRKWYYYSTRDGLADDVCYSILIDGDYVWFGTRFGLTQFYWNAPHLRGG